MISLRIFLDGVKGWVYNNQRHRANGPAIAYPNGYMVWYWYDREVDEFKHMILAGQEQLND